MRQFSNNFFVYLVRGAVYFAILIGLFGCLQSTTIRKQSKVYDPSKPSDKFKALRVTSGRAVPILIGEHQSLSLNIELNNDADYARYEIYKDGENELLKSGHVYLGPVLVHDLPEGLMHINIWACTRDRSADSRTSKETCGKAFFVRYQQTLNTDKELIEFLVRREDLIDKQKDIGEQLVAAISEYRKEKKGANKELDDFIKPVEDAGAGKVGDVIAKTPGVDNDKNSEPSDSKNKDDKKDDPTDGPLSFSNGVALLYLVGTAIYKFSGNNKNPDAIKIEYKARMEALSNEMEEAVKAYGAQKGYEAKLESLRLELEELKKIDPSSSRLQDLVNLERQLNSSAGEAEQTYKRHNDKYQQLLAKDLTAAKSKVNVWVKRAGSLTALVGAGLILFTSFDEGLLGKLDKFLDKMVLTLAGGHSSAEFKFRRNLDLIARDYRLLKDEVYYVEDLIHTHLKNANRN